MDAKILNQVVLLQELLALKLPQKNGWRFSKANTSGFAAGHPKVKPDLYPSIIVTEIEIVLFFTVVISMASNII